MLLVTCLIGWASVAAAQAADDKPIFDPPKSAPKFIEVQVDVERNPTWSPLYAETRLRWWLTRELTAREGVNFTLGPKGLHVVAKFLFFEEPRETLPHRRVPQTVPNRRGGTVLIAPEADRTPIPPLGTARIQLSYFGPDGAKLSEHELALPVPPRAEWSDETAFIGKTARLAAHYAKYYFLGTGAAPARSDTPPPATTGKKKKKSRS